MDSKTRLLHWMLNASRGGPTRIRLLRCISGNPQNTRALSMELKLDYKTVQSHMGMLIEHGIIYTPKKGYGSVYFISPEWESNEFLNNLIRGNDDGKKKRKSKKR